MTFDTEKIIEFARSNGATWTEANKFRDLVEVAIAAEREACEQKIKTILTEAQVDAVNYGGQGGEYWDGRYSAAQDCYDAIRARGEK